jgi:hypothetical protein
MLSTINAIPVAKNNSICRSGVKRRVKYTPRSKTIIDAADVSTVMSGAWDHAEEISANSGNSKRMILRFSTGAYRGE